MHSRNDSEARGAMEPTSVEGVIQPFDEMHGVDERGQASQEGIEHGVRAFHDAAPTQAASSSHA